MILMGIAILFLILQTAILAVLIMLYLDVRMPRATKEQLLKPPTRQSTQD